MDDVITISPATWPGPLAIRLDGTDCIGNRYRLLPLSDGTYLMVTRVTTGPVQPDAPFWDASRLCADGDVRKYIKTQGSIWRSGCDGTDAAAFRHEVEAYLKTLPGVLPIT